VRETNFIDQNKQKWNEFEKILQQPRRDPDKLSELFVQVTDDLSYSRTFYPNRSVKVYLNNLSQKIFSNIFRNRASGWRAFLNFWLEELPLVVYEARLEFFISVSIFFLAFGIGWLSSAYDSDFPRYILGDSYIEMTKANIENGDPMAVYKHGGRLDMFFGITLNNLYVSFLTFALGLFASIGTIGYMLYNGIMVGTFQYYFLSMNSDHPGVLRESLLTIWMHGSLEIPSIIIAGAAGIALGRGLLFPGTYSRFQAFQLSARRALNVMLGITPVIILAAFIESFITRYTDLSAGVRLGFIIFNFCFILGYFAVVPFIKSRSGRKAKLIEFRLPAVNKTIVDFHSIKKSSEIFAETFVVYNIFLRKHLKYGLLFASVITVLLYFRSHEIYEQGFYDSIFVFRNIFLLFQMSNSLTSILCTSFIVVASIFSAQFFLIRMFHRSANKKMPVLFSLQSGTMVLLILVLFSFIYILMSNSTFTRWLTLLFLPLALNLLYIINANFMNWIGGVINSVRYLGSGGWLRILETFLMTIVISFVFFLITGSPILWMYADVMTWNLPFSPEATTTILSGLIVFTLYLGMYLLIPLLVLSAGLQYFSLRETHEAYYLMEQVKKVTQEK